MENLQYVEAVKALFAIPTDCANIEEQYEQILLTFHVQPAVFRPIFEHYLPLNRSCLFGKKKKKLEYQFFFTVLLQTKTLTKQIHMIQALYQMTGIEVSAIRNAYNNRLTSQRVKLSDIVSTASPHELNQFLTQLQTEIKTIQDQNISLIHRCGEWEKKYSEEAVRHQQTREQSKSFN
jgi:hypothetical protein